MSLTISEDGNVLAETIDGVTMPADYSFSKINDYVHATETQFEDLQSLCLGMAGEIARLASKLNQEKRIGE